MEMTRTARLGWARALVAVAFALTASLLLSSCSGSPSRSATSITLAGSTSVQPFAERLAEKYQEAYPNRSAVNVQGGGSSAGAKAALSGTAQIGMMSRELAESEKELTPTVIARDAIAVVVHPSNPISDLSIEQLQDVFSGAVKDWSDLGGTTGKISVISREEGSGTRSAFEELVMKETAVDPTAVVQDSNGAVRETVGQDKNSIGYISLGLVNENVKPVPIEGVKPSVETVQQGSYTLVRPFLFVVKGEMAPEAKQFVDYVMGEDGQRTLAEEGLVVGQ